MRVYPSEYSKMLNELKKKNHKKQVEISKKLFEEANGLAKAPNLVVMIINDEIFTLEKNAFNSLSNATKNSFVNYKGILVTKNLTSQEMETIVQQSCCCCETENENKFGFAIKIDINQTSKNSDNSDSELKELEKKLKQLEKKISSLMFFLVSADDSQKDSIKEKIADLTQKANAVREQIMIIKAAKN